MTGLEPGLSDRVGETYIVMAVPGESRGGHYHPLANEWFTVIRGAAVTVLTDVATGEEFTLTLEADRPQTLMVHAGTAHRFENRSHDSEFWLLAYSDQPYDPADTVPYDPQK